MKFEIEQELAQTVINYLVRQPFEEVATIIDGLSRMQPIPEQNGQQKMPDIRKDAPTLQEQK